jgi:hypothetical protein
MTALRLAALAMVLALGSTGTAAAGDPPAAPAVKAPQASSAPDDMEPQPTQPDFTIINLPTTLRLPEHRLAFRVTHRFTRALNQGDFGSSLSDAFGLDSGARIGLELRFSPFRGAQVGVYRTNDKTVDFFGSYNVLQQGEAMPLSVSLAPAIEGTGNFKDEYSPSIGVVVGRSLGDVAAIYVVPTWVGNTNPLPEGLVDSNNTFFVGLGARVRLARGLYVVGEASPRASGFKGAFAQATSTFLEGKTVGSFAIEKQVGGHVFQINFSNAFATTPANIARGATPGKTNWYLGFNISRKFY